MPDPANAEYAYFEGGFTLLKDANISIKNHAFMYGTSLFEGIRGYWLPETQEICIFRMKEHYERLLSNSKIFFMTPELSLEKLSQLTIELIQKNAPQTDTYIRPTIYKSGTNIGPNFDNATTQVCIWSHPLGNYVDIEKGLNVCVSSWRRVDDNAIPPRAKAGGAYMNTALIVTDAKRRGFDEAISLTADGHVSEGSAMNLFIVRNGKLITPAITENILEGVTRNTLLEIAQKEFGIPTEERVVDRTELYVCDEAFFCGTGAQVAPITQIDGRTVGTGVVGPITQKLKSFYFDVVKNKVPRYKDWCTVVSVKTPIPH
jgi:branched-chain amino acid aminotransferase